MAPREAVERKVRTKGSVLGRAMETAVVGVMPRVERVEAKAEMWWWSCG